MHVSHSGRIGAADILAEKNDNTARTSTVRKRARSYRPRIHSFSLPFSKVPLHAVPDPPSSPLTSSRSASDSDANTNINTHTNSNTSANNCSAPPKYPETPSASATCLTHSRILELSDKLARQSSHQLLALTRTNTKKNAGLRPLSMAFNRVFRRMRFPPTAPTSSLSMSSIHSFASSMSLSSSSSNSLAHSASNSAPPSLPFRKSKAVPKVVSFSQNITILTPQNQAGATADEDDGGEGENEKWVDLVETKLLPNDDVCNFPPKRDRARRIALGPRRRSSLSHAELPMRIRSDTTAGVVKAPLVQLESIPRFQSLRTDTDSGLLTHLRGSKFLRNLSSYRADDGNSNHYDIDNDSPVWGDTVSKCADFAAIDCEESASSFSDSQSNDDPAESVSSCSESETRSDSNSNENSNFKDDEDEDEDETKQCIVNTKSARNLAYLYATTTLHSRPNYSELRVTK